MDGYSRFPNKILTFRLLRNPGCVIPVLLYDFPSFDVISVCYETTGDDNRKKLITIYSFVKFIWNNSYLCCGCKCSLSIRLFFLAGYEKEATGKEKPDTTVFMVVFHLLIAWQASVYASANQNYFRLSCLLCINFACIKDNNGGCF